MDKRFFADIEYSNKIAKHFPDAEWWWVPFGDTEYQIFDKFHKNARKLPYEIRRPKIYVLTIRKRIEDFIVLYESSDWRNLNYFSDKSLPNALCTLLKWLEKENLLGVDK